MILEKTKKNPKIEQNRLWFLGARASVTDLDSLFDGMKKDQPFFSQSRLQYPCMLKKKKMGGIVAKSRTLSKHAFKDA